MIGVVLACPKELHLLEHRQRAVEARRLWLQRCALANLDLEEFFMVSGPEARRCHVAPAEGHCLHLTIALEVLHGDGPPQDRMAEVLSNLHGYASECESSNTRPNTDRKSVVLGRV